MARQCVLSSIKSGIFPLRTQFHIIKWKFAEDYGLMFTIETYIQKITVWRLRGDTIERVWTQEAVVDANFISRLQRVLVSSADGALQIWDFADSPKVVESVPLGAPNRLFNSETYLLTIQDTSPKLWKWESSSSLTRMRLPDSLIFGRRAAFSPDAQRFHFPTRYSSRSSLMCVDSEGRQDNFFGDDAGYYTATLSFRSHSTREF